MKSIILNLLDSLHNNKGGFSSRKLHAIYCMIIGTITTFKFGTTTNSVELVMIWVIASFLFLGIITAQQIIDYKSSKTQPLPPSGDQK